MADAIIVHRSPIADEGGSDKKKGRLPKEASLCVRSIRFAN